MIVLVNLAAKSGPIMASQSNPRGPKGHSNAHSTSVEAGVVKGIVSGSTLQVLRVSQNDKNNARGPAEFEISLQGIRAPLGGGKDRSEEVRYLDPRDAHEPRLGRPYYRLKSPLTSTEARTDAVSSCLLAMVLPKP